MHPCKFRFELILLGIAAPLVAAACGGESTIDGFTEAEWMIISELSPLPDPPADPTNRFADDLDAAVLGQMLFFDKTLSGPILFDATADEGGLGAVGEEHKFSCVACHDPQNGFIDARSNPPDTSLAIGGWLGRNTITLVNSVYYEWSGWQGFIDTHWGHSVLALIAAGAQNSDYLRTAHVIHAKYRTEYEALFGALDPALDPEHDEADRFPPSARPSPDPENEPGPWEDMTAADQAHVIEITVNAGKAIHAYNRLLIRRNAAFDRYVAGDFAALTPAQKRGLGLFIGKAACVQCHEGPFFSDQKFHNLGVPQEGVHVPDEDRGRANGIFLVTGPMSVWGAGGPHSDDTRAPHLDGLEATDEDEGAFRTQGLRNVVDTAPYMHTGQFADLRAVMEFYNDGGAEDGFVGEKDELMVELNLTDAEMDDLVAFMESLTGEPLPAALVVDTSRQ